MAVRPTMAGIKRGQEASVQVLTLPAPVGGVDAKTPLPNMTGEFCIYSYNLTVEEGAVAVRPGYREWALDVEQTSELAIGTLIPFTTAGNNRLWAVTNEGIWDVSTYNSAPVQELQPNQTGTPLDDWTDVSADAGFGTFTAFTADNGDEYMLYADSKNGLFERNLSVPSTPLWIRPNLTSPGSGPAVNANLINFVVVHKQRIWLVEQNQTYAHYLGIGAISGATTLFYFGSKFKYGGQLVGLFNWTVDGGAGVDDYLVAVGAGGDLIPYQGIDPSQDDWQNVGSYYIGKPPKGGRFASEYAGELYLLSSFGVISMSDILKGVDLGDSNNNPMSLSFRITKLLRADVAARSDSYGWQMDFVASRGDLIIQTPEGGIERPLQYVLNLALGAWSFWRDVPMTAFAEWNNKLFIGADPAKLESNVYVMDVNRDNVTITAPALGQNGLDIDFSVLSSFSRLDSPSTYKRVQYVRADFLSVDMPPVTLVTLYDYNIGEPTATNSPSDESALSTGIWDVSTWDGALWGQGQYAPSQTVITGGNNMGRSVAIAMRGTTNQATTFIGWDVSWITGTYAL
tara:strand:- start:1219 stop:2928 length:1710 start_codon:yes stop_codon:yes gene_type:complete